MRGLLYSLGAACVFAGLLHFYGVYRNAGPGPNTALPVGDAPVSMFSSAGIRYLTMAVDVTNKYGKVTYPKGTMLRYLGQQGPRFVVQIGFDEFTVTPQMVADTPAPSM
jgi:hypothetical protein